MQFRSVQCFAVMAGLAHGMVGNLCSATDADTTVGDYPALQETVVTARLQNENLEKVPVAVDALSTSALTEQHVTNEQELQTAVPGLMTVAATSTNQLALSIRGQARDAFAYTSPTVLAYFDELQTGGLNKRYEVGGTGLGAVLGVDSVILGTPRMAGLEVAFKF
jgi:hypothetical protein